jgi:hypothetical protein
MKKWQIEYPGITPYNIKTLQDFTVDITYGINGVYGDPVACVNTVITYLKNFSRGLKQEGLPELGRQLTGSIRNVPDSFFF